MSISRVKLNFQSELHVFILWLTFFGKPFSRRQEKAIRQGKKELKKTEQDNIAQKSNDCIARLDEFLENLMKHKNSNHLLAKEFNHRAATILIKIEKFLCAEDNLSEKAKIDLLALQTKLKSNLAWVRNTYNIPIAIQKQTLETKNDPDYAQLRKKGNFDIRHQQRKHKNVHQDGH